MLSDGDPHGSYEVALGERSLGTSITRADFATALLDALGADDWIGRVVDVSTDASAAASDVRAAHPCWHPVPPHMTSACSS